MLNRQFKNREYSDNLKRVQHYVRIILKTIMLNLVPKAG